MMLDDRERLIGLEAQATAEARMLATELGKSHLRIGALEAQNRQLRAVLARYRDVRDGYGEYSAGALAATEPQP